MKSLRSTLFSTALMAAGMAISGAAFASSTWTPTAGCSDPAAPTKAYGNSWTCSSTSGASAKVTASAWSASISGSGNSRTVGATFASAYLNQNSGGFGVANKTETLSATTPEHSIDSFKTNQSNTNSLDMVLLSFGTNVTLDKIGIGWSSGDADITVLRWIGGAAGPVTGSGDSATLAGRSNGGGWELVGSFADLTNPGAPQTTNSISTGFSSTTTSSWWLISAFDTGWGASTSCTSTKGGTCDNRDDGFKLNYIVATAPAPTPEPGGSVPEPGSLALAGIAIAGVFSARRRAIQHA